MVNGVRVCQHGRVLQLIPRRRVGHGRLRSEAYFPATTLFLNTPTSDSSHSTTSPGLIGCVLPAVPVKIRSPGFSVMCLLRNDTVVGTSWTIIFVFVFSFSSPLTRT